MTIALGDCKGSSPGPDEIEYELIKQLSWKSKQKILAAFNQIWTTGTFPEEWRNATVIAVPKPGKDPEKVESYRPIALTSCLCKLMERMVNRRLIWYLENNNLISNQQFGFRKNRSTVLSILENEACKVINKGHFMSICSLDLTGAYDRCWRRGILDNLIGMHIQGRFLAFSKNFMSSRTIQVAVGNNYSDTKLIENGVPQGAVLSVTLFLVGINPIAQFSNVYSKMVGYADDWVIYSTSESHTESANAVKYCVNRVGNWALENGFTISAEKTKYICITRKLNYNTKNNIILRGQLIENVDHHKILGLIFDARLDWKLHLKTELKTTKQKAEKKIPILRCLSNWGADQDVLINVHRAVVLGTLRYGEQVYGSASDNLLDNLEATHNRGIRAALGEFCVTKTSKLLAEAGTTTLAKP
jgi:Reverse transcriptase (RNA-dependent DNA polymerase)